MKEYCKNNHKYTSETIYINIQGYTECRVCRRNAHLKYQEKHKERIKRRKRINARKYYLEDPEKFRKESREFRKGHPEIVREHSRNRRALVYRQSGNYKPWMERYYRFSQQSCCCYCEVFISTEVAAYEDSKETLEHLLPLSRGGKHSWENTALCCRYCNCTKGNKTVKEFEVYGDRRK